MKCLTICQPYTELILRGEKLVENRRWATHYRGPLLIHAGKNRTWLDTYKPLPDHMDFGAIVGRCELVACLPARKIISGEIPDEFEYLVGHKHVEGPYCWVLRDVVRFTNPIPKAGQQGLFEVHTEL